MAQPYICIWHGEMPDELVYLTKLKSGSAHRRCKLCQRARNKNSDDKHREAKRAYSRKYYGEKFELWQKSYKKWSVALKVLVFEKYGNRCACCAEANPNFLSIDHKFNDGASHRREVGKKSIYSWLKANGFPQDRFQLLCFNCNYGKRVNGGICPHEQRPRPVASASDERS